MDIAPEAIMTFDDRRDIAVPGNSALTLQFCLEHFVACAREAIQARGRFIVALSGGSTPKSIYRALSSQAQNMRIDWTKVMLFWSDERAVPPTDPNSNYHMAMESGLATLPIPRDSIFRMEAEGNIIEGARRYEEQIATHVPGLVFDLVMLGMGEDGHVASLFPHTHGLQAVHKSVIANYIPQLKCWRMTFTFDLINSARSIVIYVLGENKAKTLAEVLATSWDPMRFPAQQVGTVTHKSLWIADVQAAKLLNERWRYT